MPASVASAAPAPPAGTEAATVHVNGAAGAPLLTHPIAQRNKPVKRFMRAKRVQGLTRAAVELSLRRQRQPNT